MCVGFAIDGMTSVVFYANRTARRRVVSRCERSSNWTLGIVKSRASDVVLISESPGHFEPQFLT